MVQHQPEIKQIIDKSAEEYTRHTGVRRSGVVLCTIDPKKRSHTERSTEFNQVKPYTVDVSRAQTIGKSTVRIGLSLAVLLLVTQLIQIGS